MVAKYSIVLVNLYLATSIVKLFLLTFFSITNNNEDLITLYLCIFLLIYTRFLEKNC